MKIKTTKAAIEKTPKKYVRLVLSEKSKDYHRLVEKSNGVMEYHLGVGKYKDITPRQFTTLIRSIVQAANAHSIQYLAIQFSKTPFTQLKERGDDWVVSTIAENVYLADYKFTTYKTANKKKSQLAEVLLCGGLKKSEEVALKRGEVVATFVNHARDIASYHGTI
ncbi:MAG: M17 family peptidase N-terminal domain-containing protein [Candidatus Paceibacterota bacterium]